MAKDRSVKLRTPSLRRIATLGSLREHLQWAIELEHFTIHVTAYLEQGVKVPSPATDAIGEACKEAAVVVSIDVNERDGGTLYNTQLLFDGGGTLIQRRRKITPTYHERMIWGQGDGSGLRTVDSRSAASVSSRAGNITTLWRGKR
jgi:Carbon-nitrogen hydrolase